MIRHTQQGFTLIETLVAISVLVVALVVPLRVISQSLKSSSFTREKITAAHLAQEGIELMQAEYAANTVDLNTSWTKWGTYPTGGFSFEPATRARVDCTSTASNPCKLYLGTTGYAHTMTASTTPFSRNIKVHGYSASRPYVEVESVVTWVSAYGVTATSARTLWIYNMYE